MTGPELKRAMELGFYLQRLEKKLLDLDVGFEVELGRGPFGTWWMSGVEPVPTGKIGFRPYAQEDTLLGALSRFVFELERPLDDRS